MPSSVLSHYLSSAPNTVAEGLSPSVMIAESNHRIANNLTLIAGLLHLHAKAVRAEGAQLTAEKACGILEEVSARIEAVGRLHRLLAREDDGAVNLRDYLRHIGQAAIDSMSTRGEVDLFVRAGGACLTTADYALQIGLVVGELMTNALKYAHPAMGVKSRIELGCCEQPGGGLLVWVSDDGVGLPEGFDPEQDGGLGMRTLKAVAGQIGASLSFESTDLGLTVSLHAPAAPVARNGARFG